MSNKLSGEELAHYFFDRCHQLAYPIEIDFLRKGNGLSLSIIGKTDKRRLILRTRVTHGNPSKKDSYDKIEIALEPDTPGVDSRDVNAFLETLVLQDAIFQRGNPLYSEKRENELPDWQSVLQRDNKEGTLVCHIIDRNAGQ